MSRGDIFEALEREFGDTNGGGSRTVLVWGGKTGWIGQKLVSMINALGDGITAQPAVSRMECRESVLQELERVKPALAINAAGVTGRPNVDWCEDHKVETIRANVIGTLNLADCCQLSGVHLTVFATGCIYSYDDARPEGSGVGFLETDEPNFKGSFYSLSKGMVDKLLTSFSNVLVLRVRMPISDDLSPRNFLTKISKYEKVVNIQNSVTCLYEMLPLSLIMMNRRLCGIFNFTNEGTVSHNECLDLYKEYIDSSYTYANFTVAEQAKILKADRSNNELSCAKIASALPDVWPLVPPGKEAIRGVFQRMRSHLEQQGNLPPKRTDIIRSSQ